MSAISDKWIETLIDAYPSAKVTANGLKILQNHVVIAADQNGYDIEVVMSAVNAHIATSRFFPTVADILEHMRSESTRSKANKISSGEAGGLVYPPHWDVCKTCEMPSPLANTPECYFCLGIAEARQESAQFMTPAWVASDRVLDGERLTLAEADAYIKKAKQKYANDDHLPILLSAIHLMTDGFDLESLITR